MAAVAGMTVLKLKAGGSKPWKDDEQKMDFGLPMAFIIDKRAVLFHVVYAILGGFANLIFSPELILKQQI